MLENQEIWMVRDEAFMTYPFSSYDKAKDFYEAIGDGAVMYLTRLDMMI